MLQAVTRGQEARDLRKPDRFQPNQTGMVYERDRETFVLGPRVVGEVIGERSRVFRQFPLSGPGWAAMPISCSSTTVSIAFSFLNKNTISRAWIPGIRRGRQSSRALGSASFFAPLREASGPGDR